MYLWHELMQLRKQHVCILKWVVEGSKYIWSSKDTPINSTVKMYIFRGIYNRTVI